MLRIQLARIFILSIFTSSAIGVVAESSTEQKVKKALELLKDDKAQCREYTLELLATSTDAHDLYGLVKSNFILGYIEKKQGDFGKSIIYYLEGIRYAKDATYENATKDLVSLLQNSGHIFKAFGDYDLARKYYSEAMDISSVNGDYQKYTSLLIQTAKVLRAEKKYDESAKLLESTFPNLNNLKKSTVADIYNQLGLIYTDARNKDKAVLNFQKLFDYVKDDLSIETKYFAKGSHNMGNLFFKLDDFAVAATYFKDAIKFKNSMNTPESSLFLSYKDLSETYIKMQSYDSAELFLNQALEYYPNATTIDKYYELFKFFAIVKKEAGDLASYASFQAKFSETLEEHYEKQRQIEAADKKYNLDLITQRYFALVAQEERNEQIQYYSAVGGSFLVTLIVLIIAFFQYRKYRLRKDLEASLKPYIKNAL